MGKNKDEFEEIGADLDETFVDDLSDEDDDGGAAEQPAPAAAPASQKKRGKKGAPAEEVDDDDVDVAEPKAKRGGGQQKRKNTVAAIAIGAMVVVGSAGFFYLTAPKAPVQNMMSLFDVPVQTQTVLTDSAPHQGHVPEVPVVQDQGPVMAETQAAALAGGEISLEHERLQQTTQQAVSEATQDLSNQVMAMGLQIAELQARLEATANQTSCDTNAIVEELRRKMKEDAASEKSASAAVAKKETPKPAVKQTKQAPPKPKATDSWKVLGLSADRAVVITSKGDQAVVSVGDVVEGATIKQIDPVKGVVVTSEGTVK